MAAALLAATVLGAGCRRESTSAPAPARRAARAAPARPGSHPEVEARLLADLKAVRSPADGQGKVWLDPAPPPLHIGDRSRFRFVFEAGPLGVAEGGAIFLQVSPFWGWSKIQTEAPDIAGYTTFSTDAPGVRLEQGPVENPYLLPILVRRRALRAGERVEVVYGAGTAGAVVDRFAERGERFWFHVDGDGDGIRGTIADSPTVDILPGPAARAVAWLPGTARPGDTVPLTIALLDRNGNAGVVDAATVVFDDPPDGLRLPDKVELTPADQGQRRIDVPVVGEGVERVKLTVQGVGEGPFDVETNPMLVLADAPRLLFGDLHGHSNWSDGTGIPEDYFRYGRDVAALDVLALTDHDHWGTPFLDASPQRWKEIQALAERFYEPGRFVTVPGFEWTNWVYGHRHVLYFDGEGPLISSVDPKTDTPTKLWNALRGREALTLAHHSAGGPVAVDWSFPPDPVLEPVTEIVSAHGSSEAPDTPIPIYDAVRGNWVRDQLVKGYRLGFVGSGDSHDGHPGLPQLNAPSGGLAGIWSDEKTREGVLAALRARHVYATNGPRIVLRAALAGHRVGEVIPIAELAAAAAGGRDVELTVHAVAPGPIAHVDVIHGARVVQSADADGRREVLVKWAVPPLHPGDFLYVRVVQQDGGAAWSSPWFIQ